jgi:hypothetical protein
MKTDFIHCPNEDMNEPLSLSYSQEESLPDISHDCTNDCMDSVALYHVPYASDVSDSKEEPIVEEDLSLFLQEVSHDIFSPEIEERDRGIVHFSVQDQGALGSPIFDEYSDEEEQIHFADLRSNQPSYDSYESDYDGEQYCEEISYQETAEDIQQSSLQISEPACTIFEPGSADNNKQSIINSEVSLQLCSDLQAVVGGSHDQHEDMQKSSDVQLKQQEEVFLFSFIDLFADYLGSLSSLDVRTLLSNEGWLFCSFELHINNLWVPAFIIVVSRISPANQMLVWFHWKHDLT